MRMQCMGFKAIGSGLCNSLVKRYVRSNCWYDSAGTVVVCPLALYLYYLDID